MKPWMLRIAAAERNAPTGERGVHRWVIDALHCSEEGADVVVALVKMLLPMAHPINYCGGDERGSCCDPYKQRADKRCPNAPQS